MRVYETRGVCEARVCETRPTGAAARRSGTAGRWGGAAGDLQRRREAQQRDCPPCGPGRKQLRAAVLRHRDMSTSCGEIRDDNTRDDKTRDHKTRDHKSRDLKTRDHKTRDDTSVAAMLRREETGRGGGMNGV